MSRARAYQEDNLSHPRPVGLPLRGAARLRADGTDTLTLVKRVIVPAGRDRADRYDAPDAVVHRSVSQLRGETPGMQELRRRVLRVAATDLPVLVVGERGTETAIVARALHEESRRSVRPFVSVDCASLQEIGPALLGSARGGTLCLHDIGLLGDALQAQLVHLLDRSADGVTETPWVRVVATSGEPVESLVAAGTLRAALGQHLGVVALTVPPLRERKADLPELVEQVLTECGHRLGIPVRAVDDAAMTLLRQHDWPGNVRELRRLLEGALVLADGVRITPRELPAWLAEESTTESTTAPDLSALVARLAELPFVEARDHALREFDRAFLSAALAQHGGNVARTARALGLHRQSLQKLLVRRALRAPGESAAAAG